MNNTLITKLKNAMNSLHPIEAVDEIIREYDEVLRLVEWRKKILHSGKSLKIHEKELKKIGKIIEDSGYYISFCEKDIDTEVREYFSNL